MWAACIAHVADVLLKDSPQKPESNMSFTGGLSPTDQEDSRQLVARRGKKACSCRREGAASRTPLGPLVAFRLLATFSGKTRQLLDECDPKCKCKPVAFKVKAEPFEI